MNREHEAALAAYQIIHPEGPAFSTLDVGAQLRWREAYGVARQVNPVIRKMSPAMDLNESAFNYARTMTGGTPANKVKVFASSAYARVLVELHDKYGCDVFELPVECYARPWTWVIASGDGMVWSDPTY
jgi:hypothetical protein